MTAALLINHNFQKKSKQYYKSWFDAVVMWTNKVDRSGGPDTCHLWRGPIDTGCGYGRIFDAKGMPYAHRFTWELANKRKIPKGKMVLHSRYCKSKLCCNPEHLRLGTHQENVEDAMATKRYSHKHFTEKQIQRIVALRFKSGWTYDRIAKKMHRSNRCIVDICRGRTHQKLTGIVTSGTLRAGSNRGNHRSEAPHYAAAKSEA